jgi:glycosyltransferase involved in cell wall biosynthesis
MFLDIADPRMVAAGIEVRVVGDIPDDFRHAMERRYRSVTFTGFVSDPTPHLAARIAVAAEPIGGGFKMKLLEYIFRRLPVAVLKDCAAGLPPQVLAGTLLYEDLHSLVDGIVAMIDDPARLNDLQDRAFAAADRLFDWADRGQALLAAITDIRRRNRSAAALRRGATRADRSHLQTVSPV